MNKKIAISVADSSDLVSMGWDKQALRNFVKDLSYQFLNAGYKIIYGGKLVKGGFTEMFKDFSKQYEKKVKSKNEVTITNYLAWPYYNQMTPADETSYKTPFFSLMKASPSEYVSSEQMENYIMPMDDETMFLYATSMTSMRQQVEQNACARVIIGGKMKGFTGCMPGIIEEFLIAQSYHHPIYLIGGFGGAARVITQIVEGKDRNTSVDLLKTVLSTPQYKALYKYYATKGLNIDYTILDSFNIEDLENGLTTEENLRLFHSVNPDEIITLVLKGLKEKLLTNF